MSELKEKFKNFFNKEGNNKKKIENLIVFLVLLIICIIAINVIWNDNKKEAKTDKDTTKQLAGLTNNSTNDETTSVGSEYNLKEDLENILSKISGAGKVNVLITYSETSQVVAMYNENTKESTTEENDTNGGTRTIQQTDKNKEVVYKEENGEKLPITQKVVMPQIEGAIILAQGANNAVVKTNIIQAVEAVTGLATHKIQVFELKAD